MVDQSKRIVLYVCGITSLVVGIVVLTLAFWVPIEAQTEGVKVQPAVLPKAKREENVTELKESDFRPVWRKSLQGPLEDPKPVEVSTEKPKPTPKVQPTRSITLTAKLVGTLVDDDPSKSLAWIAVKGKQNTFREGDTLVGHPGSPTILSIGKDEATIKLLEQTHTLKIERPEVFQAVSSSANDDN